MSLSDPAAISKAPSADLKVIFPDEKVMKQVVLAARRVSSPKKRSSVNKASLSRSAAEPNGQESEALLSLPTTSKTEEELCELCIETNRAPLFLAFTIVMLGFLQPDQPLSSRLSIAQAVVSAGAQSKAKYLGLTTSPTAEEDVWLRGRDVAVMRRHTTSSASEVPSEPGAQQTSTASHQAFWGIDLEALRKSNGPLIAGASGGREAIGPPIHTPQSARQYLLKSMKIVTQETSQSGSKKKSAAEIMADKEEAAAVVLRAIEINSIAEHSPGIPSSDPTSRKGKLAGAKEVH
ncbi:uncharacterized protein AB675_6590 [Cyphellophora attinorum]|uniref:Uncharacterized protein n=1 Tax=Cyphellophora attinorum TaxID=1664694 RepID=A0A0N1P0S1_9EURO|nr:uncharacterized protein AB675_6590 [Phialophora attinorum]KPI43754.1 hypothetical protein AB675_6590 [Phialophora attinorum]